ncbi:hypothetical protein LQR31_09980 [Chromobacterium vaccinii]|uniref:hypothetical protein n=1 Tax=Chromobacterium vaccinii TaxID=1108595 RepID=UPI001E606E2E|nr:hypothetical protein [Chromobacterium vaccinii]MCD4484800.1 hypothetical protein [Chromobacterium vaccinii]
MNNNQKIQYILKDINKSLTFIHEFIDEPSLKLDDQYKKINYTYFRMFCCHFESLLILTTNNHFSSAILLARTMLELFVKSYYFEFIEKGKGSNVTDFLDGKKDFPTFFAMTKALEEYNGNSFGDFKESFKQFTKSGLASYEKFSLFSHGRGEVLKGFYEHKNISYTTEQISDVLLTAKGLFEQLSLLLFFTQNKVYEIGLVLEKFKQV